MASSYQSFLERAQARLAEASTVQAEIAARTSMAVYLGRRGELEAATAQIASIRTAPNPGTYSLAIASANLAEGVLATCDADYGKALDKLRRAQTLASAGGDALLSRWCESWIAHAEFNLGRLVEMARIAGSLIREASPDEHSTLARIASTLGIGAHFANRYDVAKYWYEIARRHAVHEADDLTIDAILYNVTAFRLNNLRLSEIDGQPEFGELRRAAQELASSLNYDRLKAAASYRWAIPLLQLQLAMLRGDWREARTLSQSWVVESLGKAPDRTNRLTLADHAFCCAMDGDIDAALLAKDKFESMVVTDAAADEAAISCYRLSGVARAAGDTDLANRLFADARLYLATHHDQQRQYLEAAAAIAVPSRYVFSDA